MMVPSPSCLATERVYRDSNEHRKALAMIWMPGSAYTGRGTSIRRRDEPVDSTGYGKTSMHDCFSDADGDGQVRKLDRGAAEEMKVRRRQLRE